MTVQKQLSPLKLKIASIEESVGKLSEEVAFDVNRIEKVTKKCLNSIPTVERE